MRRRRLGTFCVAVAGVVAVVLGVSCAPTRQSPSGTQEPGSTKPRPVSVADFPMLRPEYMSDVSVTGYLLSLSGETSRGARLVLVDLGATLPARTVTATPRGLVPGARVVVDLGEPIYVDGAYEAESVAVVEPPPYLELQRKLASHGVSLTIDPRTLGLVDFLGEGTASFSVGRSGDLDLYMVGADSPGDARARVAKAVREAGSKGKRLATLYLYQSGAYVVAYLHYPDGAADGSDIRPRLARALGRPVEVPWRLGL